MKREQVIHGLCSLLSISRIADERNILQSEVKQEIDQKETSIVCLHKKYYNEFINIFEQL